MIRILKYCSDIHLEMSNDIEVLPHVAELYNFTAKPNHRYYLALVGDIGSVFTPSLQSFLSKVSPKYEHVFFIAGNHEYYNIQSDRVQIPLKTFDEINTELELTCKRAGSNIHFLNNRTFQLDEFKVIGTTLWSRVPDHAKAMVQSNLNDYNLIGVRDYYTQQLRPINVNDTNAIHQKAVQFLEREINGSYNCIVLTHHAPLYSNPAENKMLCSPHYLDSPINCAFHTDLSSLIHPPVLLWIFGHTHYTTKFITNGVVIASNQVGYDRSPYDYKTNEEIVLGYAKQ